MVREAVREDLEQVPGLYLYLHEQFVPALSEYLMSVRNQIVEDENHHLTVKGVENKIVSSCVCVVIPNLTRNVRPYAFVENVVSHGDYYIAENGYGVMVITSMEIYGRTEHGKYHR